MTEPKQRVFHTDGFTRGGQVFAHTWRMRWQNLRLVMLLSLPLFPLGLWGALKLFGGTWWHIIDFYLVAYVGGHLKLDLWQGIQPLLQWVDHSTHGTMPWAHGSVQGFETVLRLSHGGVLRMQTVEFLRHPWTQTLASSFHGHMLFGLGLWILGMGGIYGLWQGKSRRLEAGRKLRGSALVPCKDLQGQLEKTRQASDLRIAPGLSYLKNAETLHTLVLGTTGSGKTNAIHGILQQVRERGHCTIILDTQGTYVDRYYTVDRGDVILNPFDTRSVRWDPWADCHETPDFDALAQALIPEPAVASNPVWHRNAREILSITAEKLSLEDPPLLQDLMGYACWRSPSEVRDFYRGTPVESLMSAKGKGEETLHSVRMHMTDAMKRLALLPTQGTPWSLKQWVKAPPQPGSWLFISCQEKDRATLGPLMGFWVSLAIQGLMDRGEDLSHRCWMILDELFALEGGPPASLMTLLREGRKYGACGVLGFQSLGAVEKALGAPGMREILTLCQTKILLRTPEPHSATYLAQLLGEEEVLEASESLSMGAHHMRDGVNLSHQRRQKPIIPPSTLMDLPNLEALVAIGAGWPITRLSFPLHRYPHRSRQKDFQRAVRMLRKAEGATP